ncbi:hypothetical protein HAHI6034_07835 [Hathewaya histolytica]|uniref:Uncharacterized protein n=1 Tax=Hathewaya histolytica TaxID=1498 RepID=A0A4V6KCS9_HATHI|nr:hypothetical protein [Hathewaya histolytica]VTQ81987.1 Uncharacterised protein [Hathewaya histolytica]
MISCVEKFKKETGCFFSCLNALICRRGAFANDVYISYTTISPVGGGWGDTSTSYDTKKWNGDGSVRVNSTTNGRRSTYRMKSNQAVGNPTVNLYQGQGSKLPVGSIRNGQTVKLQSTTPVSDAGLYRTTCRGNWKSN